MTKLRLKIDVQGIVQGVGFRPFVYNLAKRLALTGHIFNNRLGVTIEIQGANEDCRSFIQTLKTDPPPLSQITDITTTYLEYSLDESQFTIKESVDYGSDITLISPDKDVCPECLGELFDVNDRRYAYPFLNCVNCGPRYTLIRRMPYDRSNTSMAAFEMCSVCKAEYNDPKNRRFHAQPTACAVCGPSLKLLDSKGTEISCEDPLGDTIREIKGGRVVAIKGLGGYHLVCDATNEVSVAELRKRKMRNEKPFAVMSKDLVSIRTYARMNKLEEKLLRSRERPIVLLKKRREEILAPSIAPGISEYGVFLPYAPIQYMLYKDAMPIALVMTSGNRSEEPIVFDENELIERLGGIADFYLVNNRPIVWKCDDSIVRAVGNERMIIRRSRGFAPAPIFLDKEVPPIIACGGDIKNVFCLAKGGVAFPGPHIGDIENMEAYRSFVESIDHFKKIFDIEPLSVAVDLHPNYFSSEYGRGLDLPTVEVQHHHAHIVSVMAENNLHKEVIGISLDGTGYGDDGTLWGGEILLCDRSNYRRFGHFPKLRLPGGEKAIREPWRTAVALMYEILGEKLFDLHPGFVTALGKNKIKNIIKIIDAGFNCPITTSAGRLFDAVSSILLIQHYNNFEGQAPVILEAYADRVASDAFGFKIGKEGELDFEEMIMGLIKMSASKERRALGAAMFHNTIAQAVLMICLEIKKRSAHTDVCLGGGVFQNILLLTKLKSTLINEGFNCHLPRQLPINDGGLALGQVVIAASK